MSTNRGVVNLTKHPHFVHPDCRRANAAYDEAKASALEALSALDLALDLAGEAEFDGGTRDEDEIASLLSRVMQTRKTLSDARLGGWYAGLRVGTNGTARELPENRKPHR